MGCTISYGARSFCCYSVTRRAISSTPGGDEDISRTARENGLVKGACRSESRLGTNGIGTVLVDRIPLQVFGAEHYYEVHAN